MQAETIREEPGYESDVEGLSPFEIKKREVAQRPTISILLQGEKIADSEGDDEQARMLHDLALENLTVTGKLIPIIARKELAEELAEESCVIPEAIESG